MTSSTGPAYDREAEVTQAYRDHAAVVRRHALRAAFGDAGAADDATQEAFLRAFRSWPSLRGESSGHQRAWLSTTARNHIIDSWRKTKLEDPADDDRVLEQHPDPRITEDAVVTGIIAADFWKELTTAVAPRAARAAYLRWNEGWPDTQIAHHLGVDRATVRRDLSKARDAAQRPGLIDRFTAGNEGGQA